MFCIKCGARNEDGVAFCSQCGSPMIKNRAQAEAAQEANGAGAYRAQANGANANRAQARGSAGARRAPRPVNKKKPKTAIVFGIVALALAAVIVLQNLGIVGLFKDGFSASSQSASKGYDTPGDVAEAFAAALRNQDMDEALSLFGCDIRAQEYDLEATIERLCAWTYALTPNYPAENEIYLVGNEVKLRSYAATMIENMVASLEATDDQAEKYLSSSIVTKDEDDASAFARKTYSELSDICSFEEAETFKVKAVIGEACLYDPAVTSTTMLSYQKRADRNGAEMNSAYGVVYEYDGDEYFGGMTLLQYDGKWYISSLNSALLGQSSYCTLEKLGSTDFEEEIEDAISRGDEYRSDVADSAEPYISSSDDDYSEMKSQLGGTEGIEERMRLAYYYYEA